MLFSFLLKLKLRYFIRQALAGVPGFEDDCDLKVGLDSNAELYLENLYDVLKSFSKR